MALPSKELAERLAHVQRSDLLTIAYLKAWLAAKPNDFPIYLTLARHNLLLGNFDEALAVLRRLRDLPSSPLRRDADRLKLAILERKAYSLPEDSIERRALLAQIAQELAALAATATTNAELRELLVRAQSIDNSKLAADLLRRMLAGRIDPNSVDWLKRMSQLAIGWGEVDLALRSLWVAFEQANNNKERRELLMDVGRTMQAINQLGEYFKIIEARLAAVAPDKAMYEFLIRLALAASRLDLADRWAHEMLRFSWLQPSPPVALTTHPAVARAYAPSTSPRTVVVADWMVRRVQHVPLQTEAPLTVAPEDSAPAGAPSKSPTSSDPAAIPRLPFDDQAYKLAYDVFLANSNQADAYKVAESAVRQAPNHMEWRRRFAQIADWTGKPTIALEQWLYLAQSGKDTAAWEQVRRLATGVWDAQALLSLYRWEQSVRPNDVQAELRLIAMLETLGRASEAVTWIKQRLSSASPGSHRTALLDAALALAERVAEEDWLLSLLNEQQQLQPDSKRALRISSIHMRRNDAAKAFDTLDAMRDRAADKTLWPAAREREMGFWRTYAELANQRQMEDKAWFAYQQLLIRELFDEQMLYDIASYLQDYSPQAAAVVLEFAYRQFGKPAALERLFATYTNMADFSALQALLDRLSPADQAKLSDNPTVLQLRVQYYQSTGQFDLARKDMDALLAKSPDSAALKSSMMWLLLAQKDANALRIALRAWAGAAEHNEVLWGPFGASWIALQEPSKALPYFRRQARNHKDYLWWLAYADVLADNGMSDAAWSLRRRAFTELRAQPPRIEQTERTEQVALTSADKARPRAEAEIRDRVVALAMQFAPGDGARSVLRNLVKDRETLAIALPAEEVNLRNKGAGRVVRNGRTVHTAEPSSAIKKSAIAIDTGKIIEVTDAGGLLRLLAPMLAAVNTSLPPPIEPSADMIAADTPAEQRQHLAAARELALSYFLSSENYDSARAWLLSRYADELSKPAWAQLALALAQKDQNKLARLLDEIPDWLPKLESVDAMQKTQRLAAAQSLAFETLESRPYSNEAHQKLIDTMVNEAPNIQTRVSGGYQGVLDYTTFGVDASWRVPLAMMMGVAVERSRLSVADSSQLGTIPAHEQTVALSLRGIGEQSWWLATLARRSASRDFNGLRLDWQQTIDHRLQLLVSAGLRQPAVEMAALRIGGMKNLVESRATWSVTQREYLAGYLHLGRLLSQTATELADARIFSLEAGHRFRTEYPDVTFRAAYTNSSYRQRDAAQDDTIVRSVAPASAVNPLESFVPRGSNQFSLSAALGESARSGISRGLRPYGEFGLRRNSITGTGYNLRAGMTTSLLGADRLSMFLNSISATPGNARGVRELGLAYQWLY